MIVVSDASPLINLVPTSLASSRRVISPGLLELRESFLRRVETNRAILAAAQCVHL
jgi:hypothetical protein